MRVCALFFLYNKEKGETTMDMKKLIDMLLKCDELKDIPMDSIFRVVSSLFNILNNGNVFYKE